MKMTAKDVLAIVDKLVTNPDGTIEPADAFLVAEQICAAAYAAQGNPVDDPDANYAQWLAREARNAPMFERLYCKLRDIAHDWHREAIRRSTGAEKGMYSTSMLDPEQAAEIARKSAYDAVTDWDY